MTAAVCRLIRRDKIESSLQEKREKLETALRHKLPDDTMIAVHAALLIVRKILQELDEA